MIADALNALREPDGSFDWLRLAAEFAATALVMVAVPALFALALVAAGVRP